MRSLQEEILIASLQSQLLIETVRLKSITTEFLKEYGGVKNDLQIQHNICSAVIEEIQRQINKLTVTIIP